MVCVHEYNVGVCVCVCLCMCDCALLLISYSNLQVLIQDFSPHSIEMACSMLEHCGRFLYRSPDSQPRTRVLLVCVCGGVGGWCWSTTPLSSDAPSPPCTPCPGHVGSQEAGPPPPRAVHQHDRQRRVLQQPSSSHSGESESHSSFKYILKSK